MRHCKQIWGEYYVLKMDVAKYFQNINKDILYNLLNKRVQDQKLMRLLKEIIYISNVCQYIFKRNRPICKKQTKM